MAPLPFSTTAQITAQGGAAVGDPYPCSPAWPVGSSASRGGVAYDASAQIDLAAKSDLDHANRKVVIDGVTFSVVDAVANAFGVPHVELRLRRIKGG